ncbi:MAG: hypothetical protein ACPG8V_01445 [Alphaproteobacteria bacterium]
METLLVNPSFWVAIGFVTVVLIIVFKARGAVMNSSYDRIQRITDEIAGAEKVREESQSLLVEQEKKYRDIVNDSKEFVEQSREEANAISKEIKENTKTSIEAAKHRSADAITRAEVEAVSEIKRMAFEKASVVITEIAKSKEVSDKVIDNSVGDIKGFKK